MVSINGNIILQYITICNDFQIIYIYINENMFNDEI